MKSFAQFLVLVGSMAPGVAWAQSSDADRATARALARQGFEAQNRGAYGIAAEDFQRADELVHAPTLLLGLARAQTGLGKLVEAQETYQRILRERVDAQAPAPFAKAVEEAKSEVTALAPRLAWVTIDVQGPPAPSVAVDHAAVPPAALGVRRACNPGSHTVNASAQGFAPAERTFVVGEGDVQTVTLSLDSLATPAPSEISRPTPFGTKAGIAALGIGAAGLVVGGVTGVLVLTKHASLTNACPGGHCSSSESDELSTYHTLASVSTASLIVGACAAVTGMTLLLATPKPAPITVYAGFLRAGVAGSF